MSTCTSSFVEDTTKCMGLRSVVGRSEALVLSIQYLRYFNVGDQLPLVLN